MTTKTVFAAAFGLCLVAIAGASTASAALKDEAEIQERLIVIGMAYEIDQKCDDLSARLIRGLSALNAVETRAEELGYSETEIDSYVDDKVEKARLIEIAKSRLADLGAVTGQADTFCTVGQAQIDQGSPIGLLLR